LSTALRRSGPIPWASSSSRSRGARPAPLADAGGPWDWQRELLDKLGRKLREGHDLGKLVPILMARASGHGIGKSTLVGWVILRRLGDPLARSRPWPIRASSSPPTLPRS
jgi:hypothetical protein